MPLRYVYRLEATSMFLSGSVGQAMAVSAGPNFVVDGPVEMSDAAKATAASPIRSGADDPPATTTKMRTSDIEAHELTLVQPGIYDLLEVLRVE